ncbi:hypothetical protein SEA_WOFFORD_260 [Streptomyces phage Wofford]|uniref:Uncharacterized protein n=1 Tax=Streptomyces phage Wofford TaxID=2283267 RepID=A0A345M9M9_9CAUD|nr:hypothetical protein HWB78_gp002 [Streptomyces phage Wollford]YP_009839903.1 hypothetical protein HWB78_gp059 [Streptomyces phage Wollford]AXH67200.1 hypothetical protein SEA_WOFFORD_2 [Streptomyces phage Wollford]AXH67394.1 hypothetical protein SEA_WOFFORD_260 [Streptomyces phage Wollford]
MEFTVEQLRLIRASCQVAMGNRKPKDYYEPWKGVYEVATAKLKDLGEED